MKNLRLCYSKRIAMFCTLIFVGISAMGQVSPKEKKIIEDSKMAKIAFIKNDPSLKTKFKDAYGYAIFPNVGKGGLIVGGASGNGAVYEKGRLRGKAKMTQVTVGLQAGGQKYREVIFFENKTDFERFKEDKFELSAQASAVMVKSGASENAQYSDGVLIFTQTKGGAMVEASVGGQKFDYKKFLIAL